MARQLPMLCSCPPHGVATVVCRSSCSLGSSRWEAMRRGLQWRGAMGAATSVDSAAMPASVWAFREAETSGAAASSAGPSVTAGSLTGAMADEAPSHTSALIPTTTTRTTWITGTLRTTRTIRTRMAATATCLRIPSLKSASGRTVCSTVAPHALTRAERTLSLGWGPTRLPFASRRRD